MRKYSRAIDRWRVRKVEIMQINFKFNPDNGKNAKWVSETTSREMSQPFALEIGYIVDQEQLLNMAYILNYLVIGVFTVFIGIKKLKKL